MKPSKIIGLFVYILAASFLFPANGCKSKPVWSGEFIGSVIERVEKQGNVLTIEKVETKTTQDFKVSLTKTSEIDAEMAFGSCTLKVSIYSESTAAVRQGQTSAVSVNGYQDNLELAGNVALVKDGLKFVIRGTKVEDFKPTNYSFDFNGREK